MAYLVSLSQSSSNTPNVQGQANADAPEGSYGARHPRNSSLRSESDPNSRSVMAGAGVEADMGMDENNTNRLLYTSKDLTKSAFKVLEELRQQNQLCDVTIRVGNRDCVAHRAVLAATCPYFRGMFTGGYYYQEFIMSCLYI